MSETETTATPAPAARKGASGDRVLGPALWERVLHTVIAPAIADVVARNPDIGTKGDLLTAFLREFPDCSASFTTFSGWCQDIGVEFTRRVEVRIPGFRHAPPLRSQPLLEDPGIVQPDPPRPVSSSSDGEGDMFAHIPEILPGGMTRPVVVGRDVAAPEDFSFLEGGKAR